jgi:hypothetical protein
MNHEEILNPLEHKFVNKYSRCSPLGKQAATSPPGELAKNPLEKSDLCP